MPIKLERTYGLMRVDGIVQGQINGTVMGEFHGLVRGEANIFVNMGKIEKQEDGNNSAQLIEAKVVENNNSENTNEENNADNKADNIVDNNVENNVIYLADKDGGQDE
jgi:hypothetical protein